MFLHLGTLHHLIEYLAFRALHEVHLEVVVVEQLHDGVVINRLLVQVSFLVIVLPEGVLLSQQVEVDGFLELKASSFERFYCSQLGAEVLSSTKPGHLNIMTPLP
jgi:hypothetical protein